MKKKIIIPIVAVVLCACIAAAAFFLVFKNEPENGSSEPANVPSADIDNEVSSGEALPESSEEDYADDGDYADADEEEYIVPVSVKNTNPIITDFMGMGSVIYQLFTYIPDQYGRNMTEKQAQEQFDRMQDMGITYVRSYYNSWMASDGKGGFDYENANMQGFYREALELKKRGIDIAITNAWSLHALTDNSSTIPSPELYVEGDFDQTVKNHTEWMVDSLLAMRAHGCTNIKDIILFTEPGKTYYNDEEKMYYEFDAWLQAVSALDKGMRDAGIRQYYRFIGPNQSNYNDASFLDYALKNADQYVDIYSSHNYPTATSLADDVYYDQVKLLWDGQYLETMRKYKSKKPFWIDEWGARQKDDNLGMDMSWRGTQQAVCAAASMNFGISNTILWSLFDQQWPNNRGSGGEFLDGVQVTGLAPSIFISTIPTTQYYAYTLMSKYITARGAGEVYLCESPEYSGIYAAFSKNENGDMTLLVVNAYFMETKFEINFDKALNSILYRHTYDPNTVVPDTRGQVLPTDRAYKTVKNKLVDELPGGAVAVYTTIKG